MFILSGEDFRESIALQHRDAKQDLVKYCEIILERVDEPATMPARYWWDKVWTFTHKLEDAKNQIDEDGFHSPWPAALILKSSQSCRHKSPLFPVPKVEGTEYVMLYWRDPLQPPDAPGSIATLYWKDELNLIVDQEGEMWDRDGRQKTSPATKVDFKVAINRWLAAARRLPAEKPYPYRVDQWNDGLMGVSASAEKIERFVRWFNDNKAEILREKDKRKTLHRLQKCQSLAHVLADDLAAASQVNELLKETGPITDWLNRVSHGDFDASDRLEAACQFQIQSLRTAAANTAAVLHDGQPTESVNRNEERKPLEAVEKSAAASMAADSETPVLKSGQGTHGLPVQLMTVKEVVKKLAHKNIEITDKTLNNSYTEAWGKPDGKRGNAHAYAWSKIRTIVEGQFSVSFGE